LNKTPKFKELSGKTIVLEFWGTWCRPCIMSIPHINEMVEKSANDSVIFISVSKEEPSKVSKFLESKEIKSYVAIDLNSLTNINYKISSIPKAYVIDSFGRIIWEGHPMNLTSDIINFIASKKHYEKPKE
jgi:thiol-disulfide isomerase/thioredoxin